VARDGLDVTRRNVGDMVLGESVVWSIVGTGVGNIGEGDGGRTGAVVKRIVGYSVGGRPVGKEVGSSMGNATGTSVGAVVVCTFLAFPLAAFLSLFAPCNFRRGDIEGSTTGLASGGTIDGAVAVLLLLLLLLQSWCWWDNVDADEHVALAFLMHATNDNDRRSTCSMDDFIMIRLSSCLV
jgi:hypothetical protein